jgi:hypothetical protein
MPVDSDATPLPAVVSPVDSEARLLSVVLRPVDNEPKPLAVDVDSEVSWLTFTASVASTPAATFFNATGAVAPAPPNVTLECALLSYCTASPRPVDREARLLLVVSRPVERELTPVDSELRPLAVEVDRLVTLLFVASRPVDSEPRPLAVDVDSEVNWLTLTASVAFTPAATFFNATGAVAPVPPSVTLECVLSSYCTALPRPVDSDATLLLVVSRPVDSELTPVDNELRPLAVEVDRLVTLLFVASRPVDSEPKPLAVEVDRLVTLLFVASRPVDNEPRPLAVEVDSEVSWLTFTASVSATPAATFFSATGAVAPVPPSVTLE